MTIMKITFNLDGSGIYYDPCNPIHLDALIHWAVTPFFVPKDLRNPARDEPPFEFLLPIRQQNINGIPVYRASALIPEGCTNEDIVHWRKKVRQSRIGATKGSPNLTNGIYRDYNQPMPLLLTHRMVGWMEADLKDTKKFLKQLKYLGKKRSEGYGKIVSVDIEESQDDFCLMRDGVAMRYLPDTDGSRLIRPSPPYWNNCGRVPCRDVGT